MGSDSRESGGEVEGAMHGQVCQLGRRLFVSTLSNALRFKQLALLLTAEVLIFFFFRLDPVLFKDPVSNLRKKYKALEGVP